LCCLILKTVRGYIDKLIIMLCLSERSAVGEIRQLRYLRCGYSASPISLFGQVNKGIYFIKNNNLYYDLLFSDREDIVAEYRRLILVIVYLWFCGLMCLLMNITNV